MTTDDDLTEADRAALQLALDLTLANDPEDEGRVEQVQSMLADRTWHDVASFCSYHQQMERLNLHPWQMPPAWIITDAMADEILAKGPVLSATGSGEDIGNASIARLTKRMLQWGVSVFHPDPLRAVAEAQKAKRR